MRSAQPISPFQRLGFLAALALALVVLPAGCRTFRSRKVSDENIAAARHLSLQGLDAQQRRDWERAETLFASAILKCPSDERAQAGYAESLWRRSANAEAVRHMEQAVRVSGNDPDRLVRLGQMYCAQGDLAGAQRLADQAIAASPQFPAAWALRGDVLAAQGERTQALASYHRALDYQPAFPAVQLAIAAIYRAENRPQRALATLESLEAACPASELPPAVALEKSLALSALGRPSEGAAPAAMAQSPAPVAPASHEASWK